LKSLLEGGKLGYVDRTRFTPEEDLEVRNVLKKLTEHPMFGSYILLGILDKIYLTEEGWKIIDFKFAYPDNRLKEKYEFQLKFYLYIVKELFNAKEARLFYLKDGSLSAPVMLESTFEKELLERIERFGGDSNGN